MELQMLCQAVDTATGYMCALGELLEERLLDIPERIKDAVEYGVHSGVTVTLVVA
jgi:hypothetical protein